MINEVFDSATGSEISESDLLPLTTGLCELPKLFNRLLFKRIDTKSTGKITKAQFQKFYSGEFQKADITKRLFMLLARVGAKYIEKDDLRPLMQLLLEAHPGLEFLKATPEFQDKYGKFFAGSEWAVTKKSIADTVIYRIFYAVDRNDDGKISLREFKKSPLKDALFKVSEEDDINKVFFFYIRTLCGDHKKHSPKNFSHTNISMCCIASSGNWMRITTF